MRHDLDKPDILEMTPLAWAIAYRRAAHAEMLLRAGANPAGAGRSSDRTSPMQIARAMQWREIIEKMLRSGGEWLADPPKLASGLDSALDRLAKPYRARCRETSAPTSS